MYMPTFPLIYGLHTNIICPHRVRREEKRGCKMQRDAFPNHFQTSFASQELGIQLHLLSTGSTKKSA